MDQLTALQNSIGTDTYEIKEMIGKGSGGEIYLAYHKRLRQYVVLKRIRGKIDPSRTRVETDILKKVRHAYLPQVYDYIEADGQVYTVIDYIRGTSFKQILKRGQKPHDSFLIKWFIQLCEALEVLHRQRPPIIHGDIKPDNIMQTEDGNICLIDFNISSFYTGGETRLYGYTKGYAAPEQMSYRRVIDPPQQVARSPQYRSNGDEPTELLTDRQNVRKQYRSDYSTGAVSGGETGSSSNTPGYSYPASRHYAYMDPRTDIYSLGATMFHMFTGVKPNPNIDIDRVLDQYCPNMKPSLREIFRKTMAINPADRFRTVAELRRALLDMPRLDERYRGLKVRQAIATVCISLLAVASFTTAFFGWRRVVADNGTDAVNDMRISYNEAQDINSFRNTALQAEEKADRIKDNKKKAELYYIAGRCYIETEDYEEAEQSLAKAVDLDGESQADYHSYYAMALTENQELDAAQEELDTALEQGADIAESSYAKGLIAYEQGDYASADDNFSACIDAARDQSSSYKQNLMMQAYYKMSLHYKDTTSVDQLEKKAEILGNACDDMPDGYPKPEVFYEPLIQSYYKLGELTENTEYYRAANERLQEMSDKSIMGEADTLCRMARTDYAHLQDTAAAESKLKEALQLAPDDFQPYMHLALNEYKKYDLSSGYARENFDWAPFCDYYRDAVRLYNESDSTGDGSDRMDELRELRRQLEQNGKIVSE